MLEKQEVIKIRELCDEDKKFAKGCQELLDDQVVNDVEQELKNYFTLILCNIQLMETMNDKLEESPHWVQLVEDIKGLYRLWEQFSQYATCEQIKWKNINVQSMAESIVKQYDTICIIKGIDMKVMVADDAKDIAKSFLTDGSKLREILSYLIRNAAQSVGVNGKVRIVIEKEEDGALKVSINNNREKMSEEEKEEIFKTRFIPSNRETGLGLPLCAKFISVLNGTINVNSTEEETSFQVKLPIVA